MSTVREGPKFKETKMRTDSKVVWISRSSSFAVACVVAVPESGRQLLFRTPTTVCGSSGIRLVFSSEIIVNSLQLQVGNFFFAHQQLFASIGSSCSTAFYGDLLCQFKLL
ncbi:unnamed protein product [Rhizoctonia solani]|uniref:Uncharacterized protein n=1 Tax=Rhizoctonia solani TaxID=456999 RepID=A0A8H3HBQ8_9AGAM|nr:unnamed protein product [Rhizoctonia solani]